MNAIWHSPPTYTESLSEIFLKLTHKVWLVNRTYRVWENENYPMNELIFMKVLLQRIVAYVKDLDQ